MSTTIKNVAIAGASGDLGTAIVRQLLASGLFTITALRRPTSKATFPAEVKVVDVDFSSKESLTAALKGQDAVLSTISHDWDVQYTLVDAAVAAGVHRFIPSEFGSDMGNPKAAKLPMLRDKVKITDYVVEKSKTTPLTYSVVRNNAFLDWGLRMGLLLKMDEAKPVMYDGGDYPFSATTLDTIGRAVVGILGKPAETKNRILYIHDLVVTQKELLSVAMEVAPNKPWAPVDVSLADMVAKGQAGLDKGDFSWPNILPFIVSAVLSPGYGGRIATTDNELLGIKEMTREDVKEVMKKIIA